MFGKRFASRSTSSRAIEPLDRSRLDRSSSTPRETVVEPEDGTDDSGLDAPASSVTSGSTQSGTGRVPMARDPLGLHVVHCPKEPRKLDIIFVHGLGGTSRLSWSKNKDLSKFWPSTFLPLEPEISLGRILTFGYNANIVRDASNKASSVLDFAKELLFELKYGRDENAEELDMGAVPIIFIVHSMGGLIVKEAYLQGQNDPEYEKQIQMVSAILFLSTPHRGTNLAETLNRILQVSFISAPKQFIGDLTKNSFTLQKLNDQFRHVAPKLDIVSFYETQMTSIGFRKNKVMVLEKESSILGYPGEISKALHADHHGVCKYESRQDPIYITVRNVLKSLVEKVSLPKMTNSSSSLEDDRFDTEYILGVVEAPDVDYNFFRGRWASGTCHWILDHPDFVDWECDPDPNPRALWIHGAAASGKSVLASFIINHLVESHKSCQYFFFRFGDHNKRSVGMLLRSLASQVATSVSPFRKKLLQISEDISRIKSGDVQSLWQKVFKSVLFKTPLLQPLFWVIDGLEESDTPRTVLKFLSDVLSVSVPIRIVITSRKSQELASAFAKSFAGPNFGVLANDGCEFDFPKFIHQELNITDQEFKKEVAKNVLKRAMKNFLWVHLAIQKVNKCVTKADVRKAFEQLPPGMDAMYGRMAQFVADIPESTDRTRASDILAWVTCASRTLDVQELCEALETRDEEIIDLPKSIEDLCGGFAVVDGDGKVTLIHQTAREYLLDDQVRPFNINRRAAHEQLFLRCMAELTNSTLRSRFNRGQGSVFLQYAVTEWFRHLCEGAPISKNSMSVLMKFIRSSSILVWIQVLASHEQLRILISASAYLAKFAEKLRCSDLDKSAPERQITERETIEKWSIDLVKLVGKFGVNLVRSPEAIHRLIPPFCPEESNLYQLYGRKEIKSLSVRGFSNTSWDDSLARLSFGSRPHVEGISAVGSSIFILDLSGNVIIYGSQSFEKQHEIQQGERIRFMHTNTNGDLLVTYGSSLTKVWDIRHGKCVATVKNPERSTRPQSMMFIEDDTAILLGCDDMCVRRWRITKPEDEWCIIAELDEQHFEGAILNSPSCMAISSDGNQVALGYRGYPVSVWELQGPELVGHCARRDSENAWGEVTQLVWHPYSGEVLGLYLEGIVFKWNPYDYDVEEIRTGGAKLTVSNNGNFFATGDATGNVKVFSMSELCLIHHLVAQNPVLDLCFSPDSHRLYDIRGPFGNVWEPSVLIKHYEMTEKSSDNASDSQSMSARSKLPGIQSWSIDAITAVVAHPNGRYYASGTEDGVTDLFDTFSGKVGNLGWSRSYMTTEQMAWSPNGRYIAVGDLSGRLSVKTFQPKSDVSAQWSTQSRLEMPIAKSRGAIRQVLFHPDSTRIFVYTPSTLSIITISTKNVEASVTLSPPSQLYKWISHPIDENVLIAVSPGKIQLRAWDNLRELRTFCTTLPLIDQLASFRLESSKESDIDDSQSGLEKSSMILGSADPRNIQETVDRVLLTSERKYLFVQTSHHVDHSTHRQKQIKLFDVAALSHSQEGYLPLKDLKHDELSGSSHNVERPRELEYITLPENLACEIEVPLSFLARDRLVFLDRHFWVCSWRLPLPSNTGSRRTSETVASREHSPFRPLVPGRRPSEALMSGGVMTEIRPHFFLPGDWISPDCIALCTVTSDGTLLCPRNGEVAVIKCGSLKS